MTLATSQHEDGGLQPERSSLALTRTYVLMIATDVLLARIASGSLAILGLAMLTALFPLGLLAVRSLHHRRVVSAFREDRHVAPLAFNLGLLVHACWIASLGILTLQIS